MWNHSPQCLPSHCTIGSPIIWASAVPENIYKHQSSCMSQFFPNGLLEIAPFSVILNSTLNVFSLEIGYTQKHWDSGHAPGWYNRQLQISHSVIAASLFITWLGEPPRLLRLWPDLYSIHIIRCIIVACLHCMVVNKVIIH